MHEIARTIPFNYLSTLGTACHSNGLFRLEICQRNSVGNQNGGKGVHQSVWNGGFYHSFPMGYCCWVFISQENKHPLWFLNVFSFTLAWEVTRVNMIEKTRLHTWEHVALASFSIPPPLKYSDVPPPCTSLRHLILNFAIHLLPTVC